MTGFMQTLWDLLPPRLRPPAAPTKRARPAQRRPVRAAAGKNAAQARYDAVVAEMLAKYGVRVRKWRKSMSGIAWELIYHDGTVKRLLESPRPKGPMSMAIFLHEIGHHAIGFNVYKPRCLEEYHAWAFALKAMEERGLNVTEAVKKRMKRSLKYAGDKAVRRGIKQLPPELVEFMTA